MLSVLYSYLSHSPPHDAFPLQGLTTNNASMIDLSLEHSKEIYTSEPVGSWAKFSRLLESLPELYIVFEQVNNPPLPAVDYV